MQLAPEKTRNQPDLLTFRPHRLLVMLRRYLLAGRKLHQSLFCNNKISVNFPFETSPLRNEIFASPNQVVKQIDQEMVHI